MRSFLDCPHNNVQEWTECCLDCGYNIYTSPQEYLADLQRKKAASVPNGVDEKDPTIKKIRRLERELSKSTAKTNG